MKCGEKGKRRPAMASKIAKMRGFGKSGWTRPWVQRVAAGLMAAAWVALASAAMGLSAPTPAPRVVVSIKPLHALAATIMQGAGEPVLLAGDGASAHHFSLRPSDAKALQEAALVIWIGPALEGFLQAPLAALREGRGELRLQDAPGLTLAPLPSRAGSDANHTHIADAALDGHLWLDPMNAIAIGAAIAGRLSAIDPERAALYQENAMRQRQALEALDAELRALLAGLGDKPYIVLHDAYGYFERRYGLRSIGAVAVVPERPTGAKSLSLLHRRMQEEGVRCAFGEPGSSLKALETLTLGTSVRLGTLDPEGAGLPAGRALYETMMRGNARALADCLRGG
jgi:zinc transport system substrate-binding protein